MKKITCISLCEVMEHVYNQINNFEQIIAKISQEAGYERCERIYIGSSFCGQYFLHLSDKLLEELIAVCKAEQIKMTLVLPVFTEKYLDKGKEKVRELIMQYEGIIDEITVNDYGMLAYMHQYIGKIKLNMGRLFMKDYREPRYEAYFNEVLKPRGFTSYLKRLVKQYGVSGIEFDPTHRKIDFSEKPEGVTIGIYTPYAYMTVGQICQIGSISKSIEKKFRPNEPCALECTKYRMKYFMGDDRDWRRIGRAIYFKNSKPELLGIDAVREIYVPFDWEVEE